MLEFGFILWPNWPNISLFFLKKLLKLLWMALDWWIDFSNHFTKYNC